MSAVARAVALPNTNARWDSGCESSIAKVSKLGLKAQALDNDLACNRGYLAKSMRSGGLVDPLAAEERSNLFLDSTGLDSLPGVEGL